jgi:RluA family pseudouridine synthase
VPAANRLIVPNELDGSRLDRALRHLIPGLGKNEASMLIGRKRVRVNGRPVTFDSWEVRNGYVIEIAGVVSTTADAHVLEPDWILADDGLLIAVNKPSGLRPEPRGVVDNDNLVTLLSAHINEVMVPVHRIDRDTSGVMLLVRKSAPRSLRSELDAAFKGRDVTKHYVAVVARPHQLKAGRLVDLIGQDREHRDRMAVVERGGDRAETIIELGEFNAKRQQLLLNPVTGRTHQLRLQLAHRGSPILGDRLYASKAVSQAASRLLLHAHQFELPAVGDHGPRVFEAPIPRELTIIPVTETEVTDVPRTKATREPNVPKPPRETKRQSADRITRQK